MGLTIVGKATLASRFGGLTSYTAQTYLAYGTGATAFDKTQTALVAQSGDRAAATVTSATTTDTDDTCQLAYSFSIASPVTVAEIGTFSAGTGTNMGARTVLSSTKSLSAGSTYAVVYKIVVSA